MKKALKISLLLFVSTVSLSLISASEKAEALDYRLPDPASTPSKAEVYLVNGKTKYVEKTNSLMRLWFKQPSGNSVVIENGNYCSSNKGDDIETEDRPGGFGSIPGRHEITEFIVKGLNSNGKAIEITEYGKKYARTNKGACEATITINIPTISASRIENGYYFVNLDVNHVSGFSGPMNSYSVKVSPAATSYIGLKGGDTNGYNMTLDQANDDPTNIRYTAEFGTNCDVDDKEDARIHFYDLDNGGDSGAQLKGRVTVKLFRIGVGPVNFSDSSNGNPGETWTPSKGEDALQWVEFKALKDAKYRLEIYNVYHNNTIQFSLPYSQIFRLPCPPPPDPGTIKPGVTLTGSFEPGGVAIATATVTKNSSTDTATSGYTRQFWFENNGNDTFAGPANGPPADQNIQNTTVANQSYPNATNQLGNWNSMPIPANAQRVCTRLLLSNPRPTGVFTIANPNPAGPVCRDITRKPYFEVLNGDVNTSCNNGAITGFWNSASSNGSGSELAAFAGATISGFATRSKSVADPTRPKQLTFANNLANNFGNDFNGQVGCGTFPSMTGVPAGDVTLTSMAHPRIVNGEIRVNGNLYIEEDLEYANKAGLSLDTLPSFKVTVSGNIYVNYKVTKLEGVYQSNGTIYTCTNGNLKPTDAALASLASICSSKLTVNGAFTANAIKYLRLTGTSAIPGAAETFVYDPLVWLHSLAPSTINSSSGKFDAYTTMPPIL